MSEPEKPPHTCGNCAFGIATAPPVAIELAPAAPVWTCHALPPTATPSGNAVWPVVPSSEWCGSWLPLSRL